MQRHGVRQGSESEVSAYSPEEIWEDYDEEKRQEYGATGVPVPTCGQARPRRKSALVTSSERRQRHEDEAWANWLASFDSDDASTDFDSLWQEFEEMTSHGAPSPTSTTCRRPQENDSILILRDPWIGLILSGSKTLEIRGARLRPQTMWLGSRGLIFGQARIESAREIETDEAWQELYPQHRWDRSTRPYKRTFAMHLTEVQRLNRPQHYRHSRGAIGIVKYHKPEASGIATGSKPAAATASSKRKPRQVYAKPEVSRDAPAQHAPAAGATTAKQRSGDKRTTPVAVGNVPRKRQRKYDETRRGQNGKASI